MPKLKCKSVRQKIIEERRIEKKLRHMVTESKYSARLCATDDQPAMVDLFGNPIVFEQNHHYRL